jgi:hypothetical protein
LTEPTRLCDNLTQGRLFDNDLKYQEKSEMNRLSLLLLAGLAAAALLAPTEAARAVTYCLVGEIDQCRFTSLEQCLTSANGLGGFCVVDSADTSTPPRTRR